MLNAYEVELRMTSRATKVQRMVTRREHAHNTHDAVVQALLNAGVDANLAGEDVALVHVGPPADEIRTAEVAVMREIAARVAAVTGGPNA